MILSPKQNEFIVNATHRYNIKEGAVRSGKSYMDVLYTIPQRIIERKGKAGLSVIIGVSKSTIERNVLEPMQEIYGHKQVGDIGSNNKAKIFGEEVYCLGAEKVNQVAKIRGASFKYVYGDEVTEWNPKVFDIIKSRMDKPYSCFDGACNPDTPKHWFKLFLDSDADIYRQKYTIFDNPYLDKAFVENLCLEYRGTVNYNRYIEGQWVAAEGAVYKLFNDALAQNENPYALYEKPTNLVRINIGVDFGGSQSGHAFVATGYTRGFNDLIALKSEWIDCEGDEEIDPNKLGDLFVEFVQQILSLFGFVDHVYCDNAEQTLIAGLRSTARKRGLGWLHIDDARKVRINDRIRCAQRLMGGNRFFYYAPLCKTLEDALMGALWNPKSVTKDERLDDGTSDIDTLDAFEYTYENDIAMLIKYE